LTLLGSKAAAPARTSPHQPAPSGARALPSPTMTPVARPAIAAARGARRWLLWLALSLAAAHCMAAWHVYSHSPAQQAERASKGAHAGADSCVLCVAAAGIGGAPAASPPWHVTAVSQPEPAPLHDLGRAQSPTARPYAIRAPPPLAA
jgi:hypothetical protein